MQNYDRFKPSQPPPTYGQNFVPPQDSKQTFHQTFKIEKPKYNDLWAGLLVRELAGALGVLWRLFC